MLPTIRQQEPTSILTPFVESMVKQDFDYLVEKAGKYGVLKGLVEYWKQHPKLHEFHLEGNVADDDAESSLANEIDAIPVDVAEEEIRGARVIQHSQVQGSSVKPILPIEILLKIAEYMDDGIDFINWVKALEKQQYPSRGGLSLILDLQEKTGLSSNEIWPTLFMCHTEATRENALLLSKVSHFFQKIDFSLSSHWTEHYIRVAVPSSKPHVVASISPITESDLTALAYCTITELRINGQGLANIDSSVAPLCKSLKEVTGLKELRLHDIPPVFFDALHKSLPDFSNLQVLYFEGGKQPDLRLHNLARALSLTKLKRLGLGSFNLSVEDMHALSQGIAESGLKTLLLGSPNIDNDQDIEPIIRHLTNGLVKSCVETVELGSWYLNRERLQYLMENLQNIKCLKKLTLYCDLSVQDAPFYLGCALKTTADVYVELPDCIDDMVNLQELAPRYKQYKEIYTVEEREFFSEIFQYDQDDAKI